MRSIISAEPNASAWPSGSGSVPRWLSARQARRIVSRSYRSRSFIATTPLLPGRAPGAIRERSRHRSAACGRLRTRYGQISSTVGPTALPFSSHRHDACALGDRGWTGPTTYPPTLSLHHHASRSSVVAMAILASHLSKPPALDLPIMNEPSPSSSPARYAEVGVSMRERYHAYAAKPSYWRTAVKNLERAEHEASLPSLLDEATA